MSVDANYFKAVTKIIISVVQAVTFQNDSCMLDCIIVGKLPQLIAQFEDVFRNLNSILILNTNYHATNSLLSAQRNYVFLSFAYSKDSIRYILENECSTFN